MKSIEQHQFAKLVADTLYSIDKTKKDSFLNSVAETMSRIPSKRTRESLLEVIHQVINEREGIIKAEITSASILDAEVKEKLRHALAKKYSAKDVELKEKIDPSLIGGVKIRFRDEVYDATIKKSLRTLAEQLHA